MDDLTEHLKKGPVSTLDSMRVDAYLGQTTSGRRGLLNKVSTTPLHWISQFSFFRAQKRNKATFPTTQGWPSYTTVAKSNSDVVWVEA